MSEERRSVRRAEILTVVGPTAVGKTSVAIALARALGGEIVSADSRQIYRGMDIGTAKPTADELAQARHHLIDIVEPTDSYDAVRYADAAETVITRLLDENAAPIVAGGTGFYLESLFKGLFEVNTEHIGRHDSADRLVNGTSFLKRHLAGNIALRHNTGHLVTIHDKHSADILVLHELQCV